MVEIAQRLDAFGNTTLLDQPLALSSKIALFTAREARTVSI